MNPNFKIHSLAIVSQSFKLKKIDDFRTASAFIKELPYKRNFDKSDALCVLKDLGGTCSTKHALLKTLAHENGFENFKLMLGIFRMNDKNTPKISKVLQRYHLKEMPEAHNYLKYEEQILDFTNKNSSADDFLPDLITEIEIQPNQITGFKVEYHKEFLKNYLSENKIIPYEIQEFWSIREECIAALQQ